MKNQIKTTSKRAILFLFLAAFMGLSNIANAQLYEGSAYAYVKGDQGARWTVNVVHHAGVSSESEARHILQADIKREMSYTDKLDSEIYYSIDRINSDDENRYNGEASVKVENDNGSTRYIEVNLGSSRYESKAEAKFWLRNLIVKEMNTSTERTITGISYSIRTAN